MTLLKDIKLSVNQIIDFLKRLFTNQTGKETDALYRLLYDLVHDNEQALSLACIQTQNAFASQWEDLPNGNALLSDPWFRHNVRRILCEEEIQINPNWFMGKSILDAGCGNGRWSYGFAQLGANITAVDVSLVALNNTEKALEKLSVNKEFIHSSLEDLNTHCSSQFDLVFSWGVAHHCKSFNQSLDQLMQRVKEGGMLYLYLYGRESCSYKEDLKLFKERIFYNSLLTEVEKLSFLQKKSKGDKSKLHIFHDLYAPLINRRLSFPYVKEFLTKRGMHNIERTIDHTELFIRAFKGDASDLKKNILPKKIRPFWFERYT
jgi:SAM-dependent methyltransferase